jgi:hypothetical protein
MNNSLEPDTALLDRMYHSYKRYMSVQLPFTPEVAVWKKWIRLV